MTFKSIIQKLNKSEVDLSNKEWNFFLSELNKKTKLSKEDWKKEIVKILKYCTPILDKLIDNLEKLEKKAKEDHSEENRENFLKLYTSIIKNILQNIDFNSGHKKEIGKFKIAGHLIDQRLKYKSPRNKQPDLFSSLKDTTIQKIENKGVERSQVVEGIKLSPSETKVIDCLCKLLHNNSQIYDKEESNYYTGNKEAQVVKYGDEDRDISPQLGFTLYEFTQEYKGNPNISGKDVENVHNILLELSKKDFLIKYKEETKQKGGGRIVRELEMFQKIIDLPTFRETKYNDKDIRTSKTEETLVRLHPIFRRQIDSKFILYPNDINKRTIIAYGSPNVSEITYRLRDYLMRLLSSPKLSREIFQDKLYYTLAEKWMKESRKKKVKEYTDKALETMIDLGLLESYKIEPAKTTGEPKVVFKLNKNFK